MSVANVGARTAASEVANAAMPRPAQAMPMPLKPGSSAQKLKMPTLRKKMRHLLKTLANAVNVARVTAMAVIVVNGRVNHVKTTRAKVLSAKRMTRPPQKWAPMTGRHRVPTLNALKPHLLHLLQRCHTPLQVKMYRLLQPRVLL